MSGAEVESRKKVGLARATERVNPASKDFVRGSFEIEEFDAEADAGLDDANDDESFEDLVLAGELQAGPGVQWKGLVGANKAAAKGDIGGDAVDFLAGLHVGEFRIGSERIADGVAAVAYTRNARRSRTCAVRHGDDFAHSKISMHTETPRVPRGG